jgi:hypothetical protein
MAWTTPYSWLQVELVAAAKANEQIRDNQLFLKTSIDDNGKLRALSSTYLADLSGANLTGVSRLASSNTHTSGTNDFNGGSTTRLKVPVGSNKWA